MGHVRETYHIAAPIDHVWEINADGRRMPQWNANVIEVRDCPERIDRVGTRFTSISLVMGRQLTGSFEVTKVEKPHLFEQRLILPGGGHGTATVTLATSGDGTDAIVSLDYELPGGLFAGIAERLLAGSIERDFRHSNENFRALCEATVPQPA